MKIDANGKPTPAGNTAGAPEGLDDLEEIGDS